MELRCLTSVSRIVFMQNKRDCNSLFFLFSPKKASMHRKEVIPCDKTKVGSA